MVTPPLPPPPLPRACTPASSFKWSPPKSFLRARKKDVCIDMGSAIQKSFHDKHWFYHPSWTNSEVLKYISHQRTRHSPWRF
ncbi:unnamed protein product [Urochloa humidicola]